jgi:hypothetical protein
MSADVKADKDIFKQIFRDGWDEFKEQHPRYAGCDEVVQKMLGCGEFEQGHAVYMCPSCFCERVVPFSCKSCFCLSCAKSYTMNWVEQVGGRLHVEVNYRHLVLTVPEALRVWFHRYPEVLYAGLMKLASVMMDDAVSQVKGCALELGYIVVLQTAGRSANYNPHLHIIMTDGGLDGEGKWHSLGYFPYEVLHKKWQYYLFTMVKEKLGEHVEVVALIDELWQRYPNGLVAYLKEESVPKVAKLARYIAKYVVSPPIALSRIIAYDPEAALVKYWYQDHRTGRKQVVVLARTRFIGRMVQHILPKGFKRIRYYGLQASCKAKKVATLLQQGVKKVVSWVAEGVELLGRKLSYRERIQRASGKDPFLCERCGKEMWLWRIWHPAYGVVYDELEQIRKGKYAHFECTQKPHQDTLAEDLQLSLFEQVPALSA